MAAEITTRDRVGKALDVLSQGLMAAVIHSLWEGGDAGLMILPAHPDWR